MSFEICDSLGICNGFQESRMSEAMSQACSLLPERMLARPDDFGGEVFRNRKKFDVETVMHCGALARILARDSRAWYFLRACCRTSWYWLWAVRRSFKASNLDPLRGMSSCFGL